jgi:integrase
MPVKKDYPRLRQQGPRFYYDHGGKPRRWEPLGKNWAQVMRRYTELEGGASESGNTVGWIINKYLAARSGLAANTLKSYRQSAATLNKVFEQCPIDHMKSGLALRFIDEHPHKQSARNAVLFLKQVYQWAAARDYIEKTPFVGLALEGKARRSRYLTDGEFIAIRAKLKPVYQISADLAYLLGLRVSGVVALKFSHIKDGILNFHPPKSKKPITYQLSAEVESVIERARTLPGSVRGLTVICNRNGSPMSEITVSRAFQTAARKAGITDVRFHDIRAKSASDDATTAQGRLGHTDARTTHGYLRKPQVVFPIKNVQL